MAANGKEESRTSKTPPHGNDGVFVSGSLQCHRIAALIAAGIGLAVLSTAVIAKNETRSDQVSEACGQIEIQACPVSRQNLAAHGTHQ